MRARLRLMKCAFVAATVFSASFALAKDPTPDEVDRARTFFNAGAQAYSAARYAEAVRSFEQAYELAPRSQLLFSLAQAERKEFFAGNDASYLRRAIQHYKVYLEVVPSGGRRSEATEAKADLEQRMARLDPAQAALSTQTEKRRARVTVYSAIEGAHASIDDGPAQDLPYFGDLGPGKHRVRVFADGYFDGEREVSGDRLVDQPVDLALKERPALVTIVSSASADIYVDGRIVAVTPLAKPVEIAPGPHVISVSANGKKPLSEEVVLPRGKPYRFEPKLETSGQRVVAYSMLGVGGVAIGTGVVFGVLSVVQEGRAKKILDERAAANIGADALSSYNGAIDRRDSFRTVSVVALSAGAALAAGGAILYLFDRPTAAVLPPRTVEPTPPPKTGHPTDLTASPLVDPGIWGASMTARF